jgi:hypothetical protein
MPRPCRAHAAPMPRPCRACSMPRPCRSERDLSRPRHSATWAWHGMALWISIGRSETAFGRPACFRLLPATTRSSTKVVVRSIPLRYNVGLAIRIFPATARTFHEAHGTVREGLGRGIASVNYRGTAWQGNGMGAAWDVWISLKVTASKRETSLKDYRI